MDLDDLRILFRVAAGPRLGFGHLVRCRSLARALGVSPLVSLRGSARTRTVADRMGMRVADDGGAAFLSDPRSRLMVVDDPSGEHAEIWVDHARQRGMVVATIHDLGLGYVPSDLCIDGSVHPPRYMRGSFGVLRGPAHAVLDPSIVRWRDRRSRLIESRRVLVALGGGAHVVTVAGRLTQAIGTVCPSAHLVVATGFADVTRLPRLSRAHWIAAPDGLGEELARADVAVLAGGVTLYEACAVGTPSVALALTPAQGLTIRSMADSGATIDGGAITGHGTARRVAAHVAHLLSDARARRHQHTAGRTLVDGRGAFRVADRLRALAHEHCDRSREVHDAA